MSLQGLSQLLESVTLVQKRINQGLSVSGILFCMFESRLSLSNEVVNEIESFVNGHRDIPCPWQNLRIFDTRIRRNVKLAESPSYGQTIFEYENSSNGAEDYMALSEEVIAMECGNNLVGQDKFYNQQPEEAEKEPEAEVKPELAEANIQPEPEANQMPDIQPSDESSCQTIEQTTTLPELPDQSVESYSTIEEIPATPYRPVESETHFTGNQISDRGDIQGI